MPSGGGNDSKNNNQNNNQNNNNNAASDPTKPYRMAPQVSTLQPALPGFQNMLAQQLGMGFGSGGGTAPDFAAMLSSMYSPMSMIQFQEPISSTAAAWDKSDHNKIKTGNKTLDALLMGKGGSSSSSSSSGSDSKGTRPTKDPRLARQPGYYLADY